MPDRHTYWMHLADDGGVARARMLGRLAVHSGDGWRDAWPRPAARRLVALLLLAPTRSLPREQVADRLFGHLAPERAARNVSKALSQARTVLPSGWLRADAATLWLDPPQPLRVDLEDASRLLEAAIGSPPSPADWTRIRSALVLSDQLLIEDMYEEWAQEPRRTLAALARQAAVALARTSHLEVDWSRVVTHDPGSVEAWSALLTAAATRGRADLAATYAECRVVHNRELGRAPDPALQELVERHRHQPAPPEDTEIVGRHSELQRLMDRAMPGGGGDSVLVIGPAGIGKTHLLQQAIRRLQEEGHLVAAGTCVADDTSVPFAALASALRFPTVPSGSLLDVLDDSDASDNSIAHLAQRINETLDAVGHPATLVIDDVHWADPALRSLLVRLAASVLNRRWTLVMAGRSDETGNPLPRVPSSCEVISLPPLSQADAAVLVRRLIGQREAVDPAASEGLVQLLAARGAGNPFFLTELARSVVDDRSADPGGDVPARVLGLLRRRREQCTAAATETLSLVALAGDLAGTELLTTMVGEQTVSSAIGELRRRFLLADGPPPLRVIHPLLREALVADLAGPTRARLHHRIADALAAQAETTGRADLAAAAATHRLAGHQAHPLPERAAEAAAAGFDAGGSALRRFAHRRAARMLEDAFAAYHDAPAVDRTRLSAAAIRAFLDLGKCRILADDEKGATQAFRDALAVAESPLDRARCYRSLASLEYRHGEMSKTAGILSLGLGDMDDELGRALLETDLAWTLHRRGRFDEALPLLEASVAVFEDGGNWEQAAWALDYLAMTQLGQGRPQDALVTLDRAMTANRAQGDHFRRGVLLIHRGRVLHSLGRSDGALGAVTEGIRILARSGDSYVLSVGHRIAADVHEGLGDRAAAVEARRAELSLLAGAGNRRHAAVANTHLAHLYQALGRADDAATAAAAARSAAAKCDPDVAADVERRLGGNTAGTPVS